MDFGYRFEPTREAVVFSLQNSMAVTLLIDDVTAELAEERIEGNEGEIFEVSEAMATFLTLKGWAEVVQQ